MGLFDEIPRHNQNEIFKKMDFRDFARFRQCSQETVALTKNFKHQLQLKVAEIDYCRARIYVQTKKDGRKHIIRQLIEPIRYETKKFTVETDFPFDDVFESFCRSTRLKAEKLHMLEEVPDQKAFNSLLKMLEVKFLYIQLYPSSDVPQVNKLQKIEIDRAEPNESGFLFLEVPNITIRREAVDPSTINKFLKQWLDGKRRIEMLFVEQLYEDNAELFEDIEVAAEDIPRPLKSISRMFLGDFHAFSLTKDGKKLFVTVETPFFNAHIPTRELVVGEGENNDFENFINSHPTVKFHENPTPGGFAPPSQEFP